MTWAWLTAQIEAALRLARREPDAMEGFDVSIEGFWRSFWALFICLPGFLLLAPAFTPPAEVPFFWLREITGYLVGWLAFPLLMMPISRWLGLARRYVPLIVAANWAAVLQMALFLVAVTLARVLPQPLSFLLVLAATILVILYQFHVIRAGLATSTGIAAGLTVLDLVSGFMIEGMFHA